MNHQINPKMNRRAAIKGVGIAAVGTLLIPSCDFLASPPVKEYPVLSNIPLMPKDWSLLDEVMQLILPTKGLEVETPESTTEFVLNFVNDCKETKDIERFKEGITALNNEVVKVFGENFNKTPETEKQLWMDDLYQKAPEPLYFFLETTRELAIKHFTTSAFFMENYMDYEFVPARFIVCQELAVKS